VLVGQKVTYFDVRREKNDIVENKFRFASTFLRFLPRYIMYTKNSEKGSEASEHLRERSQPNIKWASSIRSTALSISRTTLFGAYAGGTLETEHQNGAPHF